MSAIEKQRPDEYGAGYGCLNDAARCNLDVGDLRRFLNYQDELERDGVPWDDAEDILRGWIWDTIAP